MALLDLQNTLFCTQLEIQQLKRGQRQKEHQLAEARRATQLLEAAVQEEQQLKEVSWKHNQVRHASAVEHGLMPHANDNKVFLHMKNANQ